jgi:hypothetical protein
LIAALLERQRTLHYQPVDTPNRSSRRAPLRFFQIIPDYA